MQAIVFDFDGLILDTEVPEFEAWQAVYRHHGQSLSVQDWGRCIGSTFEQFEPHAHLESLVGRDLDRAANNAIRKKRFWELLEGRGLMPGVAEYLVSARELGLKLAVASSSTREWVGGHLERLGVEAYFSVLSCSDDVENVKPDPALFLSAVERLGVDPDRAIALEDSPNGVLAAKRAGLFTVAVPNDVTRNLTFDHADLHLESLEALSVEELVRRARQAHEVTE